MRNAILFIIFLIFSFLINVVFYYISEDYRNFLKDFKNDKYSYNSKESLDNNFYDSEWNDESSNNTNNDNILLEDNLEVVKTNNENNIIFNKLDNNKTQIKNNINLWKNYTDILDLFSDYDLQELELNTNLFDITDEYPDNYLEYYSKEFTLYFFPTKNYKEVYDIFSVLEFELPFKINKSNNFWEESFFINLNQDINDNFVRVVIANKWIVFWLKIKKSEYINIKEKLNILRTN